MRSVTKQGILSVQSTRKSKATTRLLQYATIKAFNHDSGGKQKLWAVATNSKGLIIAESGNRYDAKHPIQGQYATIGKIYNSSKYPNREEGYISDNLHCEMLLLEKLKKVPKEKRDVVNIYIGRALRNMDPGIARPCVICQNAIKRLQSRLNIKHVYWTGMQ